MSSTLAARVQRLQEQARKSWRFHDPEPGAAEGLRHAVRSMLAAGCAPELAAALAERIGTPAESEQDRRMVAAIDRRAAEQACGSVHDFLRLVGRVEALA